MFHLIKRTIKSGWSSFSRDGNLVLANIFILLMAISLITLVFLSHDISKFLISKIEEKADLSVYFKEDVLVDDILSIKKMASEIPGVKEVKYISKEETLKNFQERHKENPILMKALEEVGQNPFLASLNIKAVDAANYQAISQFFENEKISKSVEKIDYYQRKPLIERLFSISSAINRAGISLGIILCIVAVLITFNTIRLSIINLREEISVQRLVGASNWFIRGPFIVQGVFSGVIAAFVSFIIFILLSWFLTPKISIFFPDLNFFYLFREHIVFIFFLQLFSGIGLGVVSSMIAIRKYLKI